MKHHGLIITGASFTYPIGKGFVPEHAVYDSGNWEEMPVRGTGAHRIATHLRNTGKWDIEVVGPPLRFSLWLKRVAGGYKSRKKRGTFKVNISGTKMVLHIPGRVGLLWHGGWLGQWV